MRRGCAGGGTHVDPLGHGNLGDGVHRADHADGRQHVGIALRGKGGGKARVRGRAGGRVTPGGRHALSARAPAGAGAPLPAIGRRLGGGQSWLCACGAVAARAAAWTANANDRDHRSDAPPAHAAVPRPAQPSRLTEKGALSLSMTALMVARRVGTERSRSLEWTKERSECRGEHRRVLGAEGGESEQEQVARLNG